MEVRVIGSEEWLCALRELFPDERNTDVARKLGCSVRTVERYARKLSLEKSEAFREAVKVRAWVGAQRWYEYMRITGQKVVRKGAVGKPFEKGHRFSEEIEARRVKALRDRAWDERVRIIRGQIRRTGWRMRDYGRGEVE